MHYVPKWNRAESNGRVDSKDDRFSIVRMSAKEVAILDNETDKVWGRFKTVADAKKGFYDTIVSADSPRMKEIKGGGQKKTAPTGAKKQKAAKVKVKTMWDRMQRITVALLELRNAMDNGDIPAHELTKASPTVEELDGLIDEIESGWPFDEIEGFVRDAMIEAAYGMTNSFGELSVHGDESVEVKVKWASRPASGGGRRGR